MKNFIFLFAIAATISTAFAFSKHNATMTVTITNVEKVADGNKVWFEIVTDIPTRYRPGCYATGKPKGSVYDWGGLGEPQELIVNGNTTTGYFFDGPLSKGEKERNYILVDWDADGIRYETPIYTAK